MQIPNYVVPSSNNPLWGILDKTQVTTDKKTGFYEALAPYEVATLSGKFITIDGYMIVQSNAQKISKFILSKTLPRCDFCPKGQPKEMIEVSTTDPIQPTDEKIVVTGTFGQMNDRVLGVFFKIDNASVTVMPAH